MTGKEEVIPGRVEMAPDIGGTPQAQHLSHIAVLRAARMRHKAIGRGLQRYFDAVVAEPIPCEFLDLLSPAET